MNEPKSPPTARSVGLVQVYGASSRRGLAFLTETAKMTERLGFDSIWMPEHVARFEEAQSQYPYPPEPGSREPRGLGGSPRSGLYDPLLAAVAVASHTQGLRIGTSVALLPLRHPLMWAKQLSTLDHLTDGRFELGVGVGWLREEYDSLGVEFQLAWSNI